jgi:hypothetical protein
MYNHVPLVDPRFMIPELVAGLAVLAEVVLAAVGLDPELRVRDCEIERRHVGSVTSLQTVLDRESAELGMLERELQELLEPRAADGPAAIEGIEKREDLEGTRNTGPTKALGCCSDPSRVRAPTDRVVERPFDDVLRHYVSEVDERSGESRAPNSVDDHEIRRGQARSPVLHDAGEPGRGLDGRRLEDLKVVNPVEAVQSPRGAMGRRSSLQRGAGTEVLPRWRAPEWECDEHSRPRLVKEPGVDQPTHLASIESCNGSLRAGEGVVRRGCERRDNAQGVVSHAGHPTRCR